MTNQKLPLEPAFALFPTAWGSSAIAWTPDGIRGLWLPQPRSENLRRQVIADLGAAREEKPGTILTRTIDQVRRYFEGERVTFTPALDLAGATPFGRRVYAALLEIPYGRTATYAEVARMVGSPRACRAVGGANARNRVPLIVPCHRVVGADGRPGGFSGPGGVATKLRMLELEGVRLPAA